MMGNCNYCGMKGHCWSVIGWKYYAVKTVDLVSCTGYEIGRIRIGLCVVKWNGLTSFLLKNLYYLYCLNCYLV